VNSSSTPVIQPDRAKVEVVNELSRSGVEGSLNKSSMAEQAWTVGDKVTQGSVAVFVLMKIARASLLWGYGRFAWNYLDIPRIEGLQFGKHLGSGYEGGFSLRPSVDRQGLFLVFETEQAAQSFVDTSEFLAKYRRHCAEFFTVYLRPYAVKGSWSGFGFAPTQVEPSKDQPMATLTRASIRFSKARSFWRNAKPAHDAMVNAPGCLLAAGVGEAPLLRQATFTMWQNVAAMHAYARTGAHMAAIKTSYGNQYFSESMFVRFIAQDPQGVYKGVRYGRP
jgi:hypothetical protein